jgi:prepilin-type N-terminal cleavage/methylation domain-containing protein
MKKVNQKGFSIIEVLIVLAIAGLIMLVVFLAVPSLQRNARNNGRQSDASKFAAAINQCLANNNGKTDRCNTIDADAVAFNIDDYSQLTTTPAPVTSVDAGVPDDATDQMIWQFGTQCDGAGAEPSSSTRQFTVRYRVEGSGASQPACLSS